MIQHSNIIYTKTAIDEVYDTNGKDYSKWEKLLTCIKHRQTYYDFISIMEYKINSDPNNQLNYDIIDFIINYSFNSELITLISSNTFLTNFVYIIQVDKVITYNIKLKLIHLIRKWYNIFTMNPDHPATKGFVTVYYDIIYKQIPIYSQLLYPHCIRIFEEIDYIKYTLTKYNDVNELRCIKDRVNWLLKEYWSDRMICQQLNEIKNEVEFKERMFNGNERVEVMKGIIKGNKKGKGMKSVGEVGKIIKEPFEKVIWSVKKTFRDIKENDENKRIENLGVKVSKTVNNIKDKGECVVEKVEKGVKHVFANIKEKISKK